MKITKCVNGHFFDADKFKFCPHCGANVEGDNKSKEKPNRPDMVMGMMKPPEPVIRGNMRCVDEFVSEDPINTDTHIGGIILEPPPSKDALFKKDNDYRNTGTKDCKHKLIRDFNIKVGFDEIGYKCEKCGHIAVFNRFKAEEFIKEYADSEISGAFYTFPADKTGKDIISFSASFFDLPHENFRFDGNSITYYHTISPRDGGMNYPSGFFDEHTVELTKKQIRKIYAYIKKIDFSAWESYEIDDAYYIKVGSSSYNTFYSEFFDGTKYRCIFNSYDNEAFRSLYNVLAELCGIDNSFSELPQQNNPNFENYPIRKPKTYMYDCSECKRPVDEQDDFCPHCGVKLVLGSKLQSIRKEPLHIDETVFLCEKCGGIFLWEHNFCAACGVSLKSSQAELENESNANDHLQPIGKVYNGRYRVEKLIANGGMSRTYLSTDIDTGKQYLLKLINIRNESLNYINLIKKEAKLLQDINHNNAPHIVDSFAESNEYVLVSEYIDGETLETILTKSNGKLNTTTAIQIILQVADVVSYMHSLNPPIIHRDIKPLNVIITNDGRVKLVDFGIARRLVLEERYPDYHITLSRGYAAPEQYVGQEDQRSDIFSLGMMLHRLVTGIDPNKPPYETPPIRVVDKSFHNGLAYVIEKSIQRDPNERYQTCDEFISDLKNYERVKIKKSIFKK